MAEEEEYEEVVEYYIEEEVIEEGEPGEIITEVTETTYTTGSAPYTVTTKRTSDTSKHVSETPDTSHKPRKKVVRTKVDTSKFLTPYLDHSAKMQKLFSEKKYKEKFEKEKGKPYAITTDTPELRRIRKAQNQLSEVKYRMAGDLAKTNCHVDEKARDIEHAKKVSQQVSKVLYKQNWEENKEKYLLPPDAPEFVQAIKNSTLYSKKSYIEDWESDKSLFYPYDDSPELRRVAQAQKALSDIVYKKGHDERKSKYTALPDPPDVELAKKVTRQLSDLNYHEDYNKKKGKWSQTPCYDVAVARMNSDNFSMRKYQEDWENAKDQIYFMQTETPEYEVNKRAGIVASKVKYKEDYEKAKASTDYNVLPATENPLLKHLKSVGNLVNDRLYKEAYEKAKGTSINYCDTPKYQLDSVLKNFSDVKYKEAYQNNILGRYIGSFEDPYQTHCMKIEAMKSDKNYKADYEEDKSKCYFPQTITQEYEAMKKLDQCKDYVYKKHPDQIKFTQVTDSPVLVQAQINSKQLSDLNYKAKHENEKFKCSIPADAPFFLQSRVNAYNLSDNCYKYDWEQLKDKKFDIKMDAIPILAAKANRKIASDVEYKKGYEQGKGKMIGALSIEDDPKMMLSRKVAKLQSDRLYKEAYEKNKGISINYCDTPKYQVDNVLKNFSEVKYKEPYINNILGHYIGTFEDPYQTHCMKIEAMKSDKNYKADYEEDKSKCYFPQTITQEYEAIKKLDQCKDYTYKKHPDKIKFTQVTDSPVLVQAQINSKQLSDLNYKAKHESEKSKCSISPDAPLFLQSRVNAYNLSDNWYKYDWEQSKDKKFDIKMDAIPILAAKANRKIASDVEYKKGYEQSKGKLIGALSIEDDPKMVLSRKVAKLQSDREYKKGYEESKTRYTAPLDMISVIQAKKAQAIVSNTDYKHLIHNYSYPPDSIPVELAKKANAIQSDNEYKADYNSWMKGCGWVPYGSMDAEKNKRASDILNEKKYRQHPDTLKFTQIDDDPIVVQAKINQAQRSDVLYKAKNEAIIHKYHLPADAPQFIQAKVNSYNISDNYYKLGLDEMKTKGYDLRNDAISIKAAKAARNTASDFQYKKDYESAKGKLVGFRSLQDDPKLVHYMNVAKMQSEREYRKAYEESKTKYNTPLDMVNVVAAKKAQDIASNTNYKHLVHHYTFLPDAISVERSKNMMQIQSDNLYKADFNSWMKGIGWIPIGSLDVEKAKKAGDALNEKKYRQHPDTIKFTSVVDSPVMVQAKQNALQLSDRLYKSSGEEMKHTYHLTPDAPQFIQAKYNAANISDTYYKHGYHELIAKGHNVLGDAIPITLAKASRNIASDYKYKAAYEKARGKHVGFRSLQDDPKLVHSMNVAKMQSEREYKKDYEKSKTCYHTPVEMVSIQAAKQAQDVASNSHYKHLLHHYTYLPDAMSVELARNMNQIQSDNVYKQDYNSWFKGIGWSPLGSLDVETVKKAGEALNERKYRQQPGTLKFTSLVDSMPMVLAQKNTQQLSDINYKVAGEKMKHTYHLDPDVPQFIQARVNAYNISDTSYKADWKKILAKGYDLKPDAIPIIAAKASRNIASDYKYKESYEKDKGKQVGFRSLQDDPKLVHYMNVAKLQSDREYKKAYESSKTKYHSPLDMFSVMAAKKGQEVVTETNYRQHLHNYTLLPDAMSVELSRNRMQIQSDNLYKTDFNNWLRGVGWVPIQSLEVEKAKKATEILCEKKYRQHPDKLKYTIDMDAMEQVLAKQNAHTMNKRLYIEKWNKEKTDIHVMPDTPEIVLSRANQVTMSNKLYKAGWEEQKKKGYDLRSDAISIKAARASRDIASDYKYKLAFEQSRGKHIGFRSLEDDPKLVHFMNVAKMQSDREYKKGYEKSKTRFHTPVDMFSVVAAKKGQEVATNINYRNIIHTYNVLPDAMNLELAKNMMQIQSDNQYKADYDEYMKGVGWIPLGSLEAEKNKKAMEIVSETKYRQHPDKLKYSILMDSMPMVLATSNAKIMDEHLYKKDWEADKTKIHITPDIPEILLAKANAFNISNKMYKLSLEEAKKKGCDIRADAIPIQAAKASRDIASDYKYKLGYEKDKGKLVGFRSLQDDPKLVHFMHVAKMQSDREYRKAYETSKTRYNTPADTFSVMAAKEAQANITNTNYKRLIHKYILLPDAINVELARNMNRIQSDHEYKQDYNEWYKGLGWSPAGSLEVEKSKKATEIASDTKYRQHPSSFPFRKMTDSMDLELAKYNAGVMNKHSYIEAWEKDKTKIHVMPDTPDIMQAKANKFNYSQKLYKLGYEEMLKKGYDLSAEAISVKAAKASRDIASDYKYKEGYRKQQGHHIGFRNLQDDPKLVHSMKVAKIQSEREYKKDFEKWKTKYTSPVDMLGVLLAKNCQKLVSDIDYRNYLHQWTCLPDQNDVIHAKKVYEIQSDNAYKADLDWLKGIGWNTFGSLESEKNKKASEILNEKKYRQHPDTIKFTSIPDSLEVILAKENSKHRSDRLYREAWDKDKTQIHIMPDTPEIILSRANLINTSDKLYKLGYEELKKKGYDLPPDAISLKAAKASRDIASEYKYKDGYRKQLGHHVGARSIQDDPKLVHSMNVAKLQSEREYKKDFEKWKTKYTSPVDMLGVLLAKNCQKLVSDVDYRHYLHQWTCLPDQNDVVHARKTYDIQSNNVYKSDLEWLKGIGWSPSGSLEAEKNKKASQILSDHLYRQHPDTLKFTSPIDSLPMALAKHNSEIMNHRMYIDAWNKDKTSIHIMPDTPEILLSQQNKINYSDKLYKLALEESKKKGYDLRVDAIPIKAAKASRDIASEYKYKEGYRKQLGHHVGARSIQDDPKLVHSMNVAKMQSEREYKKDFEKSKTKYSTPVDMLGVLLAKNCQKLVSDVDYRHYLHQWTCLPDQNDVIHAKKVYELQSDNCYKSDMEWMRGIGWVPIGSLDTEKAKKAGQILSEKLYRQPPDKFKFTSVTDSLEMALAKHNAETMNKRLYTEAWDKDKTQIHIMPDTPEITLARQNKMNYSESLYKLSLEEAKKRGYDLRIDAIPIQAAKASRNIASDYKYKEGYRKQLGHHVGARSVQDDPKLVHSMNVAKMQSEREYKKDFEKWKTKYTSPVDMLGVLLAKNCQKLVSDVDYRHYLHQWTCLPDQNDVIQARKAYDLQSDNYYKCDLQWMKGIGWVPIGSLDVEKAKKAGEILSEKLYRQPPDKFKFTSVTDSLEMTLAKHNAETMNKRLYTEAWDKDKTTIHVMPDTPEIVLAKLNKLNYSEKLYKLAMEEAKKEGYDLRVDAIPIQAAKASRNIASDYKYKEGYRKQLGHHVGARSIQDDPKLVHSMNVAKMQSEREYKKDFEKWKTKYTSPVDMLGILLAKNCQKLVSDIDYRHYLHQWICLPDQNDVIQARKAYDLQSDAIYKQDLEWLKGIGWVPAGSLEVEKVKRAGEILSEKKYRQPPDQFRFTSITDSLEMELAKHNAEVMNKRLYTEAWDADKKTIHVMPDTPEILLAKANSANISHRLYIEGWEEAKKKGYDLRADAIPIRSAKASRDIASDYKYKDAYEKQRGHYVGVKCLQDDPKLVWFTHVAKIQSEREYKKDFEKWKTKIHSPVDMLSILLAKNCQKLVSDVDYRRYLHEWTCLPDQNDVIQAKKAYDLQSDNVYKSDMEWLRGIGWIPEGSLEVQKVKKAQEILNDRMYRQRPDSIKFTTIVDSPEIVLAKANALLQSGALYREVWDKEKTQFTLPPDTPEMVLSKANALNVSKKYYQSGWEEAKKKGHDLRVDAIEIQHAKASRNIASEYKYKEGYRKQVGHHVGFRDIYDDPKLVLAMQVAKMQSEREYKKYFEKFKTKFNSPVDMLSILLAKNCQKLVSDIDYRHYLHQWTCLPDQNDVIQAKKAYELQSDAVYKSDLEWLRGIGWMPNDSITVNHVKHAQDILSERQYRTKVDSQPFTPVADRVDYITAKQGGEILSDIKYHQEWNNIKTKYTLTETPQLEAAREAARILNHNLYKENWEKEKATGYLLPHDSVPIRHAKHSSDVQSEMKYKADYINQRGHYVGVNNMREDPKLVWFEHAGKIQNDRLYKQAYNKTKSKIHIPPDILSVIAAKDCQHVVSEIPYRHYLHEWTCHPDQNDCIQAKKAYDLQSDNLYKSDLEWIRGCGWIPLDSVEHCKVKKAQDLINKRLYTKEAINNFANFTPVEDPPDVVLAKANSINQSDLKYKETFNLEKGHYIGSDDTPALSHSREMAKLCSDFVYKESWEQGKAIGYTLPPDYIPIVGAKHADYINSQLKYKDVYEKQKGHYLAGTHINDFPSVVHSLAFQKIRSALAYRKNYEDTKAHIHIPSDMINHVLAKKCQYILSDLEYRTYLHQWNCSPEEHDVIMARRAQEILSDVLYKDDLTWLKGIGCYVWDTPQILHAKKSYDLQSQLKYTKAGKDNLPNYSVVMDTPVYVTAVQSSINASDLKYKEEYQKTKDQYTTVLETVDHERTQNLKHLFSNNLYKDAWEKVKSTSFTLPPDAVPLVRAKELKHNASIVKYREEYDRFKALYTLPRGVQDDPNTARCLRVGKLNLDRLYRETYEKNKAKIHIVPDMVDIVSAKSTQKKVSEIDYRIRLHEWANIPDLHANALARKVNDQLSDIVYKDDLNWLKGIGCFVWDTPEILHAKHAYDLRDDFKYKAKAEKMKSKYTVVMDTPVYVQNVLSGMNLSDAVYRHDYVKNIKGKYTPVDKTVDLERATHAYKIQNEALYRNAGLRALPTGYKLPADTPGFKHAKHAQYIGSYLKYKEVYEHIKAKGYNFGPKAVPFVTTRKVNKILNERLYRETYHKNKDKIHTTPDTPEIRQVKTNQESISDLIYRTDFFKMQGHLISMPYTPQTIHSRYVGEITSDVKYKSDLQWLRGLGCFLYDTPDMVRARHLRKLWSNYVYTEAAKKMHDKYRLVLDTPEYRNIQELKTHLSELVYRAAGKEQKTKYTSILDTPDFERAKRGQKLQSKYLYIELATKERPHHHAGNQTPALQLAKHVKHFASEKKYKAQYEKLKHKYVTIPDTPILIRAKKAYLNASDLRYKETFEKAKGKYHTVKDALDIVYHRKVTDDISKVKYKEKYISQLGIWRSIPDRPDHFHHRAVTDAVSDVKYKEDLTWLRGIGCYAWDTPDLVLAEKNKSLYSPCKYKESFEKMKSKFQYVADTPVNRHVKYATQLVNEKLYKSEYEKKKDKYSLVVDDPKTLLAKWGGELSSQYKYKRLYEKQKDKFTSVVDTPEHLRTTKVNKQISDILYKLEYNKAKPKGYTAIHDTPMVLHVRKVMDRISELKYKELYQQNKSHCNIVPDSVHIKAAKQAYKVNTNLDYKKKYEAAKAHWHWTVDRPDFIQAAKSSLQQSDYEYKLDREWLKGCKLSVTDDKNTVLALQNAILASDLKYKEKHNKERGTIHAVADTPQILLAKSVSSLVSENKYKEHAKKHRPHGTFTKLPETRDTVHVKEVTKNVSETNYKKKFQKEKGKSNYSIMLEPPEVKHAIEVAKNQSNIQYKKDAKSKLHYTSVADRPDIRKATQVSHLVSDIEYKAKARGEAGMGVSMLGRPDIELAKEVSKLTSQAEYIKGHLRGHGAASYDTPMMRHVKKANVLSSHVKYKERFDKEKGKKPQYDLKESKIYKTLKDAHNIASEIKYKADLKKLHKPVTDMSESLSMNHVLNTSQLASSVKYKEKYEKERGKPMLDFETPTYITAKESQHMQSEKEYKKDYEESIKGRNLSGLEITPSLLHVKYATKIASEKEYRRDLEEGVKGKGLTIVDETPDLLRAKNATSILNEKEYRRALDMEIKGRGLTALALETPDYMRARNATDIASQVKYKQSAEMEKANYTTVVDTPDIIHAQHVKNFSSQKKYKEDAERTMSYYVPVLETPEMQRVRENQKNFSMLRYQHDFQDSKGKVTVVHETPEILRVKENQKNFSTILYKEDIGTGTAIEKTPEMQRIKQTQDAISTIKYKEQIGKGIPISDLPEVKRVKETQKHISSVLYKENTGQGTPISVTPEIERVKRNQEHISSVAYKENVGTGMATPVTPEMERVKRNQENISSVLYKENLGAGTPTPITPEMERIKRNQENFSSVLYKETLGTGIPTPVTPETERVKHNQEILSSVLYKENVGKATPTPVTPEMERVKRSQEHISSVLYKEELGKGTPTPVTPEMERVKRNQEHISSVLYKEGLGKGTPTPVTPEMERAKRNQEIISSVLYKENLGRATPTPVTPEMERAKRNQENVSLVLYKESLGKGTPTPVTPEMERARRNQENISAVLYSDSFRKQVQGKAAFVLDTPEMRRVRETQRHISTVKYHEDFEKSKGSFTPVVTDPITERVKKNMQDFSDINYRGIQRRVVEMEQKRIDHDQEFNNFTDLRVWRTNPGSVFDYDPAEDNIQSRSLHLITVQAQRRSREQSRSASALSLSAGDEKSEHSEAADQHLSYYSNGGFYTTAATVDYKHAKTVELPQQRSSSVATQQTTVSSIPSHPSTAGKTYRAMYDYTAADADEVSFKDGDALVNVQAIDEGWMYGTVQRTGQTGMLPANYVEAL